MDIHLRKELNQWGLRGFVSPPHSHKYFCEEEKWVLNKPGDIVTDYEEILKKIAEGEFQKLKEEVAILKKKIELFTDFKKILITEEALIEEWDNEYDERWDEC